MAPVRNRLTSWLSSLCSRAATCAASSIAGLSRNPPNFCSSVSRERASRSSRSLPAQASRKKASRSSGGRCNAACSSLSSCFPCSESIAWSAAEFPIKPELGDAPVAPHRCGRHFEHFGRLFHTESAKKAHFDDLHLARIEPGQCVQGIVERDK